MHARGTDEPNKDRGLISDNISLRLRLHAALLLTEISPLRTYVSELKTISQFMLVLIQTETFRCEGRKGKNVGSDLIFENNSDISTA